MILKLSDGTNAYIDRRDWQWARKIFWCPGCCGAPDSRQGKLSRLVVSQFRRLRPGERVHHRNHNPRDCRRSNLFVARHKWKAPRDPDRGVSQTRHGRWVARCWVRYRLILDKVCETEAQARAVRRAFLARHGY